MSLPTTLRLCRLRLMFKRVFREVETCITLYLFYDPKFMSQKKRKIMMSVTATDMCDDNWQIRQLSNLTALHE